MVMREEKISSVIVLSTYFNYLVLILLGHMREFYRKFFPRDGLKTPKGYAPLLKDFEDFYTRRLYQRIHDCWNRPIASSPAGYIDVMERVSVDQNNNLKFTGKNIRCLNLASYNYLGFAENETFCTQRVLKSMREYGAACSSSPHELGITKLHEEAENVVARYVGKEAAMLCAMGFATNSTSLQAFAGPGCLIVSDSLNHSSLVSGARSSGAKIKVFEHNNMEDLERTLRSSIAEGQPRTHRPWKKVIIVVEGIYSMEGEIINLPKVVELKKKYKCYLYVDEAHSIGAIGPTGRGVCEYWSVNPADVDILMGTFTKSFASVGGYIAGSKDMIDYLKKTSWGSVYGSSISPVCCQQIISSMKVILNEDGTTRGKEKIAQLRANSNYFRKRLVEMGLEVYGNDDSPVVPVMLYNPAKMPGFSHQCLLRNLAVVVVGFPATSIIESRVRFCMTAGHTREDLDKALAVIDEVSDLVMIKYRKGAVKSH